MQKSVSLRLSSCAARSINALVGSSTRKPSRSSRSRRSILAGIAMVTSSNTCTSIGLTFQDALGLPLFGARPFGLGSDEGGERRRGAALHKTRPRPVRTAAARQTLERLSRGSGAQTRPSGRRMHLGRSPRATCCWSSFGRSELPRVRPTRRWPIGLLPLSCPLDGQKIEFRIVTIELSGQAPNPYQLRYHQGQGAGVPNSLQHCYPP
jgi:hypothetical protein